MKIAVVDYGSGNLASASRALALAAERASLDATVTVTADPAVVQAADRIVLPGQGAFADCASGLLAVPGMRQAIEDATSRGLEHTVTPGFAWIKGDVAEMPATGLRLPQMGWNGLNFVPGAHPLLDGLAPDDHVYFVHSYALVDGAPLETIATTDYGGTVPAIVVSGNRAGTQFHVEKSQDVGIRLLTNFLRWDP
jgi:glutamine amidotransferase